MALRCTRRTRSRIGGLALLALCALALAPLWSRLQAAADPLAWVQVCTSAGLVQAQTQPDGAPMPNPAEHLRVADGASCSPQAQAPALPAAEVVLRLPAAPAAERAAHDGAAVGHAPLWHRAQARAPPRVRSA